jgi:hypothetical protein
MLVRSFEVDTTATEVQDMLPRVNREILPPMPQTVLKTINYYAGPFSMRDRGGGEGVHADGELKGGCRI